jgi:hypothetical protein
MSTTKRKNMKQSVVAGLFALVITVTGAARAGDSPYVGAFLLLPITAEEVGLGQATLPLVDDATAFHWNPAGIAMLDGIDAAASYSRMYGGLASHQMLAIAGPTGHKDIMIGFGWVQSGVTDIPRYPELSLNYDDRDAIVRKGAEGFFSYAENAFFFTAARRFDVTLDLGWQYLTLPMQIPVGATIKYLTVSPGDTANSDGSGLGLDVGAQARFELGRTFDNDNLGEVSLGITITNVGRMQIAWNTPSKRKDVQGMGLAYGVAYAQPVAVARGVVTGSVVSTPLGYGWGLNYNILNHVNLRMGHDMVGESSVSVGAGINWKTITMDYGLQRHPLGASHRVSLHYAF